MHRHAFFAALLCAVGLTACGEKKDPVAPLLGTAPAAEIKFFNFSVGSPSVNFYADSVKMTAIVSAADTEVNLGTAYNGAGNGGLYNNVSAAQHTFTGRVTAAGADHGLAISSASQATDAGKKYSFYQSGVYSATTKTADAFILRDDWAPSTDTTIAQLRFVNAIGNAPNPIQLVIKNQATGSTEVTIGAATPYKSGTSFVSVPAGVYDLYGRYPGSSTNVFTRIGVSLVKLHIYTITARGDVTATTTASKPAFDNTANY